MKKLACAVVVSGLIGAPAFAADMPVKAPPVAPAPPPISWTGWYGGINVGGTWSDDPINLTTTNLQFCGAACNGGLASALASAQGTTGVFSGSSAGFIGGGQFGYNWQLNSWVAGFEADIQGTRVKASDGSNSTIGLVGFPANSITTNLSGSKEIDYLGTVRGRLGWLASPALLVYGTGGLAYGGVKASTNINQVFNGPTNGIATTFGSNSSISETRTGWTAGGGFEWMFVPGWSVKLEYLYYDLGRVTYNGPLVDAFLPGTVIPGSPAFFTNNVQTTTRFNGNIVRAGVNWHFW